MSGILVRIMVGMLVGIMVGMYASNVDHTGTGTDTALRSTVPVPVELRQQRRPYWGSSIKLYGLANLFQHTGTEVALPVRYGRPYR